TVPDVSPSATRRSASALFAGDGEMQARGLAVDWAATPLGATASWSPALRAAVRMCLEAQLPMAVLAGPALHVICNARYAALLDAAAAFGRPAGEVWPERAAQLARAFAGDAAPGEVTDGLARPARRPTSLTPIRADDGRVVGVLEVVIATE